MTRRALIFAAALLLVLLAAAPARADWVWPVEGEVITPYRNGDDPYAAGQHRGIDIAAATGTTVVAAAGGEVRFAGTAGSSGITVSIRTADGLFDTSYLHLSSAAVRKGQRVATGEAVGAVGTTGVRSAARPHLHFGLRDAGTRHAYHDPLTFLPPPALAPPRPRPTPAPSPVPEPLTPEPEPEQAPAARPPPAPVPLPHRLPVPPQVPAGRGAPSLRPTAPRAPRTQPAPRQATPASPRHPSPVPAQSALAADPQDRLAGSRHQAPDLGWALACLGLLAAAAILGLSGDGRDATSRSRERVAGFLRPLLGRR
jgi:murein DD-endopeptidase MepM/ murein hydrolase activator NlpD